MKFLASGEQRMYLLEEPPKNKTIFFGKFSQMWLGGRMIPKQGPSPSKKNKSPRK